MQNMTAGVDKNTYFEMCEMMGNEPVESEIPVEADDLPLELQLAFDIYYMLKDEWDTMGGSYLGKSLIGIKELLDISEVDTADQRYMIFLIKLIDSARSREVNKQLKSTKPAE